MLRSILTTALRSILRNRSFSLINMIGLSVSMSLALLIILIVRDQYSYDNFHKDADRIYRVNTRAQRVDGGSEDYASVPLPIATAIREEYSFAESVVGINRSFSGDAIFRDVNVPIHGLFVDAPFFELFNFPLEKGNAPTALSKPTDLVLTHEAAEKIFGKQDPLGQTINLSGYGDFTITGVLAELPGKTHLEFEILASTSALPLLEQNGVIGPSLHNWNNYYSSYVYFKLERGKDVSEAVAALREIYNTYFKDLKLETRDRGYELFLMSLAEITPGPEMSNQMGRALPSEVLAFMGALVLVVMIMACFNYTNLTIAKSLSRAREIGIRKVVGAGRAQVFSQFIGEAVVFSLISLACSYLILQLLKPAFLQLHLAQEFSTDLKEDFRLFFLFIPFAVVVGIIAGLLPAGYLSGIQPIRVLKDRFNLKIYSRLTFRKVLIATQFTLSIVFIIVVIVVYRQVDFMVNKDYGLDERNILNVRLQRIPFEKLAQGVRSIPGVYEVGGVSHRLGTWEDRSSDYKRNSDDESFVMRDFIVDENYISNLGLQFISGENFNPGESGGENEREVILNERALKLFGFADAHGAVGQAIFVNDSIMLTVRGVVRDFHFRPLNYEIGPLALRYSHAQLGLLSAKIDPQRKDEVFRAVGEAWAKVDPTHPVEMKMMEDEIDEAYERAGFKDIIKVIGYIAFLSVSLACLGMLGMAMYGTQTRIKEIGVRKVMGASVSQIVLMLSRSFILLLSVAAAVATPLGYFFASEFLSTYAYKITITPWLLLAGVFVVGICGILMVSSQTFKAASVNPVKSLRHE